jgi:putative transposase
MLWRATPAGWVKGIWWDVKEARKRLKKGIVPKEAVGKANPIIPRPIIHAILTSLTRLKASPQRPAALVRAAPMTPAQGADEGGARAPMSRPSGGEEVG